MKQEIVYVIVVNKAFDCDEEENVVLVTTDKDKAYKKMDELRNEVYFYSVDNGYCFKECDNCLEAYEDGYASHNHFYVNLYEKTLVN
jgi:hypothetical protein